MQLVWSDLVGETHFNIVEGALGEFDVHIQIISRNGASEIVEEQAPLAIDDKLHLGCSVGVDREAVDLRGWRLEFSDPSNREILRREAWRDDCVALVMLKGDYRVKSSILSAIVAVGLKQVHWRLEVYCPVVSSA